MKRVGREEKLSEMEPSYDQQRQESLENTPFSAHFSLIDPIPLFNYLTPLPRVKWYRTIMRVFLQFHRSYHYLLTEQQIRETVQQALGMDYPASQCVTDLEYLIENGNITTMYDWSKRATSVASFYQRALLYQATPEAIELEEFLDRQLRNRTQHGSLDQSNLPLLYNL